MSIASAFLVLLSAVVGLFVWGVAAVFARSWLFGVPLEAAASAVQRDPFTLAIVQCLAFGSALWFGLAAYAPAVRVREALVLRPVSGGALVLCGIAGLALQFPLAEVSNLVQVAVPIPETERARLEALLHAEDARAWAALFFGVAVVAPVAEELLFRGLLLPRLSARYGVPAGIAISAAFFGLAHVSFVPWAVVNFTYAAIGGALLGIVAVRTGSTRAAMAVHAGVNSAPLILSSGVIPIAGLDASLRDHIPLWILVSSAIVLASSLALAFRISERRGTPEAT